MGFNDPKRFEVTEQHLALLPHLWFNYNDYCEFGAPEVDPKRPYGNSDVYGDLAEILKLEPVSVNEYDESEFSDAQRADMLRVHKEMQTVLNILARVAIDGIATGWYATGTAYGNDWKREK